MSTHIGEETLASSRSGRQRRFNLAKLDQPNLLVCPIDLGPGALSWALIAQLKNAMRIVDVMETQIRTTIVVADQAA
uniref:Uncharacterized protein n=1 Tax=uncultured alpha proteobacterium EF100_94H03 TaxID=710800 RepID=E0Y1Z6_9PROT|nr:hypothetical protein [uncultured alpha proteobacterium EF100_94H03]